jgi:CRP/FNR family nitrogen fixation transcriptional regulator
MSFSGQTAEVYLPRHALPAGTGAEANPAARSVIDAREPPEFAALGTVCTFSRNETIFDDGESVGAFYKVVSGIVRLCRVSADGRRQIAGFRLPGDLVGFEWTDRYEMTAEAVRDVVTVRYARSRLDRLSEEKSAVRDHLLAHLREDLRSTQEHLMMLGCPTAKERVAAFLLQLARRAGAADGTTIDMQLGRQDIADYLGLTLETVSRTFSELMNRGAISSPKRRHVTIRSRARLVAQTSTVH